MQSREQFAGKRVMVVGIGNTACEVSLSLSKYTSKLYQAYRRGRIMVSRYQDNGMPTDSTIPWPALRLKYLLDFRLPWLTGAMIDKFMIHKMISDAARVEPTEHGISKRQRHQRAAKRVKKDWRLTPCPSMAHEHPAVQESFIPALYSGEILSVRGFKSFVGGSQVLLDDDSIIEVDVVIFCTGYAFDFSIMPELEMDGACGLPLTTARRISQENAAETADEDGCPTDRRKQTPLPRLYHMMFPPRYASSVAFLSWMAPQENVWCVCELASMAVAQIWAAEASRAMGLGEVPSNYRKPALLPSVDEMNAQVDNYHSWWRRECSREPSIRQGFVRAHSFYRFLHDMAGTGMYDKLDHIMSGRGWRLRWEDKRMYKCLVKGPMNSYAWRLFETNPKNIPGCGRSIWPGARQAVQDAVRYDVPSPPLAALPRLTVSSTRHIRVTKQTCRMTSCGTK